MANTGKKSLLYTFILAVLIAASYSNTLLSPFVYDDRAAIIDNRPVHMASLSFESINNVVHQSFARSRPVANISFALNYLAGGLNPFGYHIVNILIHILTAIMVYFLVKEFVFLHVAAYARECAGFAFLAAGIWALNPVQTQATTYIVQRMTTLSTLFYITAFYAYIKAGGARPTIRYCLITASCICWAAAISSKEIAVTLPVVILLYEYLFPNRRRGGQFRHKLIVFTAVSATFAVVYLTSRFGLMWLKMNPVSFLRDVIGGFNSSEDMELNITIAQRLFTQARIFFYYISLFIFPLPSRLRLMYSYPVSGSLFEPLTTFFSVAAILLMVVLSLCWKKDKTVSFFILWFIINLALESTFLRLHMVFEHRLYLPSTGIAVLVVYFMFNLYSKIKGRFTGGHLPAPVPVFLSLILMMALAASTFQRNKVWASTVTLYEDNVKKADTYLVHYGLGSAYLGAGMLDKADDEFRKSLKMVPGNSRVIYNMGLIQVKKGHWERAVYFFDKVIALAAEEDLFRAYRQKGYLYFNLGRVKQAVVELEKAIEKNSGDHLSYNYLGAAFNRLKQPDKALEQLSKAAALEEHNLDILINTAISYGLKKDYLSALRIFEKAETIDAGSFKLYYNKGLVQLAAGSYKDAAASFQKSILLGGDADAPSSRLNLAIAYFRMQRVDKAIAELETVISGGNSSALATMQPSPVLMLADFYMVQKRYAEAENTYLKALKLSPDNPLSSFKLGIFYQAVKGDLKTARQYYSTFLKMANPEVYKREMMIARTALLGLK